MYIEISKVHEYGVTLSKGNLDYAEHLKEQYKLFEPFGELVPLIDLTYYDKAYHYHDCIIALRYNNTLMRIIRSSKRKKYYFILANPYRHRHLEYYKCNLLEPNYIGVPTTKKVEDWFFYLTMDKCKQKDHVNLYLEKENSKRDELKKLGTLVKWENENKGVIQQNNLCHTIFFNAGSIHTTTEIDRYYSIDTKEFLIMINYKPENTISMAACLVKVTFENGDNLTTWINGTADDTRKYYLNKWFNIGNVEDNMQKCVEVEIIKECDKIPPYENGEV